MSKFNKITIKLFPITGVFADNKDKAQDIREHRLLPALKKGNIVVLNFMGIDSATQSFIHALISESIRLYGDEVFDKIEFKNCNDTIRRVINIVAEYMQRSTD